MTTIYLKLSDLSFEHEDEHSIRLLYDNFSVSHLMHEFSAMYHCFLCLSVAIKLV